jgi:hypothetical protein
VDEYVLDWNDLRLPDAGSCFLPTVANVNGVRFKQSNELASQPLRVAVLKELES